MPTNRTKKNMRAYNDAVAAAFLHDVLEDTDASRTAIRRQFGVRVLRAVEALTKKSHYDMADAMSDSLERILICCEKGDTFVAKVKLADRICNLDPKSIPQHWDERKKLRYKHEAQLILEKLGKYSKRLSKLLQARIDAYPVVG
jgi:(p)ppGpp synthase/HD superfamily hydrolase